MKTIMLDLPYLDEDLKERILACFACNRGGEEKALASSELTRRFLGFAVRNLPENRDGLPGDKVKAWGRITKILKASNGAASLSEEQFDFIFKAAQGCKWPTSNAEAVTLLLDHLEEVKIAKPKEAEAPSA